VYHKINEEVKIKSAANIEETSHVPIVTI